MHKVFIRTPENHEESGHGFNVGHANSSCSNRSFRILGGVRGTWKTEKQQWKESKHSRPIFHTRHITFWTRAQTDLHRHLHMGALDLRAAFSHTNCKEQHLVVHLQNNCRVADHFLFFICLFVCMDFFSLLLAFLLFLSWESGRSIVRLAELRCGSNHGYFETGGSSIGSGY